MAKAVEPISNPEPSLIIIPGRPITKKNSQRIIINRNTGRRQVIQSERYVDYEESSLWYLKKYRHISFAGPVCVTAHYWLPDRRGWPDLIGLLQATCDILEKSGIIDNDRNIVSVDGSRIMGVDRENPRVEVAVRGVEEGGV